MAEIIYNISHTLDWIDNYPIWLQLILGTSLGMIFMAIIVLCIEGIKLEIKWIIRIWRNNG